MKSFARRKWRGRSTKAHSNAEPPGDPCANDGKPPTLYLGWSRLCQAPINGLYHQGALNTISSPRETETETNADGDYRRDRGIKHLLGYEQ